MKKIIVPPGSTVRIAKRGSRVPVVPPRKPPRTSRGHGDRSPNLIPFRNDSGEEVPAFGVIKITGADNWDNDLYLLGDKPDTTFERYYAINGRVPVPADEYGLCTLDPVAEVLYDTGTGTPAVRQTWGPKYGEWKLFEDHPGFLAFGAVIDGRAMFRQTEVMNLRGKTDAAVNKGASGTISIYFGPLGTEVDSTVDVVARNRFGAVAISKWVDLAWIGAGWDLVAAEC